MFTNNAITVAATIIAGPPIAVAADTPWTHPSAAGDTGIDDTPWI